FNQWYRRTSQPSPTESRPGTWEIINAEDVGPGGEEREEMAPIGTLTAACSSALLGPRRDALGSNERPFPAARGRGYPPRPLASPTRLLPGQKAVRTCPAGAVPRTGCLVSILGTLHLALPPHKVVPSGNRLEQELYIVLHLQSSRIAS
ncbi:hypothetical protein E2320_018020, partial [Naja naja]